MQEIGVVGLGLLGSSIVERFVAAGFPVCGFDIDASRRTVAQRMGAAAATDACDVAKRCGRVVLSLPTSAIARGVIDRMGPVLSPGAIVLDTTTGDPEDSEAFAASLLKFGVAYLEANVGGSSEQVRHSDAIVICGGDADAYTRCNDILRAFSRQSFHMGPAGSGNRMKLALNLVLGLNRAALAEGLSFAASNGIDPTMALEVLQAGPAYSRAMDTKGEKMIRGDFEPQARLSQHLKDVRLIVATGAKVGAPLPFSTLHAEILQELEDAGFGAEDNSAIIRAFRKPQP